MKRKANHTHTEEIKQHAQEIWFAGLGAYAELKQSGNRRSFERMVDAGAQFELETTQSKHGHNEKFNTLRNRANQTLDKIEKAFDERVAMAMKRLGMSSKHDIMSLNARIDQLTDSIETALSEHERQKG